MLICIGTRPEIIKMAPVYFALRRAAAPVRVLHTGQHTDMAAPLYRFFGIEPEHVLSLPRASQALHGLNAELLHGIGEQVARIRPSAVLVHGDTSSAAMGALAAFYCQTPVWHVEAGLRTYQSYDPFPEEKHREIIGRIACWHFAPTRTARQNLLKEGVAEEGVQVVGNTGVDAAYLAVHRIETAQREPEGLRGLVPSELQSLSQKWRGLRWVLVTAHRRENWGEPIRQIAAAVRELIMTVPDIGILWPAHANPVVRAGMQAQIDAIPPAFRDRIVVCGPLEYPALVWFLRNAWLILTDSGGIQEEAAAFSVPVLVLRRTTERPELIEAGGGRLVGTESRAILACARNLIDDPDAYARMRMTTNPFGDGHAAERIAKVAQPATQHQQRVSA